MIGNDLPVMDFADALRVELNKVQKSNLSGLEAMLVEQATAIQSIFTSLVRRAQNQTQQKHLEAFLILCLKAQAQNSLVRLARLAEVFRSALSSRAQVAAQNVTARSPPIERLIRSRTAKMTGS